MSEKVLLSKEQCKAISIFEYLPTLPRVLGKLPVPSAVVNLYIVRRVGGWVPSVMSGV